MKCWFCCCCCSCSCCRCCYLFYCCCWSHKPTFKVWLNRVRNSWDIDDIEFVWWWWEVGGGGQKSFSCQTQLLSWAKVELGLWQLFRELVGWLIWWIDRLCFVKTKSNLQSNLMIYKLQYLGLIQSWTNCKHEDNFHLPCLSAGDYWGKPEKEVQQQSREDFFWRLQAIL